MKKFPTRLFSACLFLAFLALTGVSAFAYPELTRHGYINCTTCHVSPNGGGLLSDYGRGLSREVLSTYGAEGEGAFLHGKITQAEWLRMGGDVRALGLFNETKTYYDFRLIPMQFDLEAGVTVAKFTAVATAGPQVLVSGSHRDYSFVSRRHYLMFQASDEISVRGGRFMPAYGLNIAEHTAVTRKGLGMDEGNESYNLEAAYLGESFGTFLTFIGGRPDNSDLNKEIGGAVQSYKAVGESSKVGVNYLYGSNSLGHRHLMGPFAVVGFTKHFYLLSEFDAQFARGARNTHGIATYQKLGYEPIQGFHVFGSVEVGQLDLDNYHSRNEVYSVGVQWFPRPHFELSLTPLLKRNLAVGQVFYPAAYLMLHYYL